jgi:site-specific recombinase XerD
VSTYHGRLELLVERSRCAASQVKFWRLSRHFSRSSSTQAICAIKIFWEKALRRSWPDELVFVRATPERKLPVILTVEEVRKILACVPAQDHRVGLATIYSCGLRRSAQARG